MDSHRKYFDVASVLYYFNSVFTFLPIKFIFGLLSLMVSWIFNDQYMILFSVFLFIIIDFITAMIVARKGNIKSSGIYRTLYKCVAYFTMIVIGRVVDKHVPKPFASIMMDSFLVMTEAVSILENLHLLGFPVPHRLVTMLKVYWDRESK